MLAMLRPLWQYRGFILGMVNREIQGRYKGSVLGGLWALLNPVAMITIYTIVLSQVMRARLPGLDDSLAYSVFLCAGIFTWTMFAEIISRCVNVFVEHANLLKKNNFPRTTLPVIVVLSSMVNFVIIFGLFLIFLAVTGRFPGHTLIAMVPLIALELACAVGLGVFLGTLNVFFRDVQQITNIGLQFWFWLTPIVYPVTILPEFARDLLLTWNPLAQIVIASQDIMLMNRWPDWGELMDQAVLTVAIVVLGMATFRKLAWELVDEL